MNPGVFITGTDTDCGKTAVAVELIRALRRVGVDAVGFKPVAAGAVCRDGKLQNDDTLALIEASARELPYPLANPYCLAAPMSPHIAAAEAGVEIRAATVRRAFEQLADLSDLVVVEGAGGWRVPLSESLDIQGLALTLGLPVVLVVGLRLGCLNHAMLSEQAILSSGAALLGWIASEVDPGMLGFAENLQTLRTRLVSPCLGLLRHPASQSPDVAEIPFDLSVISGESTA